MDTREPNVSLKIFLFSFLTCRVPALRGLSAPLLLEGSSRAPTAQTAARPAQVPTDNNDDHDHDDNNKNKNKAGIQLEVEQE